MFKIIFYVVLVIGSISYVVWRYNKVKSTYEPEEIKYSMIPRLTKTVLCTDKLESIYNSMVGDIIEVYKGPTNNSDFYIHSYDGFYKLTYFQIRKLEYEYRIKIL